MATIANVVPADPNKAKSSARLSELVKHIQANPQRDQQELPGLAELLNEYADPDIQTPSMEEWFRRFMRVFKDSTTEPSYTNVKKRYTKSEQNLIDAFAVDGKSFNEIGQGFEMGLSLNAREEFKDLNPDGGNFLTNAAEEIHSWFATLLSDFRVYNDANHKNKVDVYVDKVFQNWGRTVKNTPKLTCVPTTSYGIQEIVKHANKHNMNVRASGYRHSWAPVFGKNGQILISTLDLPRASQLPNIESLPGSQWLLRPTELNSISFAAKPEPGKNRLVRVGTAVTNQQLRRWCISLGVNEASTLPLNVIMVEITLGGSNGPICHGAGRRHPTLSDLVHAIEYVDANGNLQKLSKDKDPKFMQTASGCFGLLGIVTHITLELEPMSYAYMIPEKLPITQAIPLPPEMEEADIPVVLRPKTPTTKADRAKHQAEFEKRARDYYYAEWFWFPYTSKVWVNTWETTDDPTGEAEYPTDVDVFAQFIQTILIQMIQTSEAIFDLQKAFPWTQATLMSNVALFIMPPIWGKDVGKVIKTKVPNALHFRRAIQNVRVRDVEIEIPLLPKNGGPLSSAKWTDEIDFSNAQRAWWSAILTAYKYTDTCPQRMPLEMRITGPSNVTLAPYNGHNLGTCSIEVLTLGAMGDEWIDYAQEVLDNWFDLKDSQDNYLPSRPHWAKEWVNFKVRGQSMTDYVKESYGDKITEFADTLRAIGKTQGWTLEEARERFSNEKLDELFFTPSVAKKQTPQTKSVATADVKIASVSTSEIHDSAVAA